MVYLARIWWRFAALSFVSAILLLVACDGSKPIIITEPPGPTSNEVPTSEKSEGPIDGVDLLSLLHDDPYVRPIPLPKIDDYCSSFLDAINLAILKHLEPRKFTKEALYKQALDKTVGAYKLKLVTELPIPDDYAPQDRDYDTHCAGFEALFNEYRRGFEAVDPKTASSPDLKRFFYSRALNFVLRSMDIASGFVMKQEAATNLDLGVGYDFAETTTSRYKSMDYLYVTARYACSPFKSIRRGDRIYKVNDAVVSRTPYEEIQELLAGEHSSQEAELNAAVREERVPKITVALTYRSASTADPAQLLVERATLAVNCGPSIYRDEMLPDQIGYIRIGSMDAVILKDKNNNYFKSLVNFASKPSPARAVVLDLRGNHGGALQVIGTMFAALAKSDPFVHLYFEAEPWLNPSAKHTTLLRSNSVDEGTEPIYDGPVVVLVDDNSASAAELFPAVMAAHHRAIIVSVDRTVGKAIGQQTISLPSAQTDIEKMVKAGKKRGYLNPHALIGDMHITDVRIYAPNGIDYHRNGLSDAQVDVRLDEPGLKEARQEWLQARASKLDRLLDPKLSDKFFYSDYAPSYSMPGPHNMEFADFNPPIDRWISPAGVEAGKQALEELDDDFCAQQVSPDCVLSKVLVMLEAYLKTASVPAGALP